MALKSTILKAELSVADIGRGQYGDYGLTIARHPSETDERMMLRILAFALHADDGLAFGKGLSTEDEPDLWRRDLTGAIQLWIEVGLPDEREVRKACGRAGAVHVYAYGGRAVAPWWDKVRDKLERQERLAVSEVPAEASRALATLAGRSDAPALHDPGGTDPVRRRSDVGLAGTRRAQSDARGVKPYGGADGARRRHRCLHRMTSATPATVSSMPSSETGVSDSPNSRNAMIAVTGGVR